MSKHLQDTTGWKPHIHFAPPCSSYSQARYPKIRSSANPNGINANQLTAHERNVLKHANKITSNTFKVMEELSKDGFLISLEQPAGSLMLKVRSFKSWAHKSGATPVFVDYCQYGVDCRKRAVLYTAPSSFLEKLARKRPGDRQHKSTLSGWSFDKQSRLPTARGRSAYPPDLCSEWASVFDASGF